MSTKVLIGSNALLIVALIFVLIAFASVQSELVATNRMLDQTIQMLDNAHNGWGIAQDEWHQCLTDYGRLLNNHNSP